MALTPKEAAARADCLKTVADMRETQKRTHITLDLLRMIPKQTSSIYEDERVALLAKASKFKEEVDEAVQIAESLVKWADGIVPEAGLASAAQCGSTNAKQADKPEQVEPGNDIDIGRKLREAFGDDVQIFEIRSRK